MRRFDGKTDQDRRLWRSYLNLARRHAIASGGEPASPNAAIVDDPNIQIPRRSVEALETVLFSAFALEYRLKRVLAEMGKPLTRPTTLMPLFNKFWKTLAATDRLDGTGKCSPPSQWARLEPKLKHLISLRNHIAHANYEEVLRFFGQSDPHARYLEYFNAVVDAIMLINLGTGYETRPLSAVKKYFLPLKVKPLLAKKSTCRK